METHLLIVIKHEEPLPKNLEVTDVLTDRAYQFCYAKGVPVDVTASYVEPVEEWDV